MGQHEAGGPSGTGHGIVDDGSDGLAALLAEGRGGSPEAVGLALEQFRAYLLLVAATERPDRLRGKVAPSDLVQETLVRAYQHFDGFHGDHAEDLRAWLRRILKNHLVDLARRHDAAKRLASRERPLGGTTICETAVPPSASPSGTFLAAEEQDRLTAALSRLPSHYRDAILLRHRDGCTFEELGRRTDRTEDAAKKLWARAVERLRKELGPHV